MHKPACVSILSGGLKLPLLCHKLNRRPRQRSREADERTSGSPAALQTKHTILLRAHEHLVAWMQPESSPQLDRQNQPPAGIKPSRPT